MILSSMIGLLIPQFKKADSVVGIQDTKEILIGANEITIRIGSKIKNGVQFTDFLDFYKDVTTDEEFKTILQAAWDGRQKSPAELKDIDAGEGLELAQVQIEYLPKILEAFKK